MQTRVKLGIIKNKTVLSLAFSITNVEATSFSKASKHSEWVNAMKEEYRVLIASDI